MFKVFKKQLNSTRSRRFMTCNQCGIIRNVKRSTASGYRLCRSCSSKNTNILFNSTSKAGKVGGRKTADSGKLMKCATSLSHTISAKNKRFDTLKRTGKMWSSKPEQILFELLKVKFGENDVIQHVSCLGFSIDFYIKSIQTYVQLDGEYWHGLDRPYELLQGTPKIKYDRDRQCDLCFKENKLKLIRITDKNLLKNKNEVIQLI